MGGHQKEQGAWDTLTWFAALVMLANFLNELGMVSWFSDMMKSSVSGFSWIVAFMILIVVYYYTHYFASATAHISAMYAAFLAVIVAAGARRCWRRSAWRFSATFSVRRRITAQERLRSFRSGLYIAKQMVVHRLYPVNRPYCDMACDRRIMVESIRVMVEEKGRLRSAFLFR